MKQDSSKDIKEATINWVDVDDVVSVTMYERKYIKQLKALAESYPNEVRIVAENKNGSVCVHLPKKYCHCTFSVGRAKIEMTEEQKLAARDRLEKARAARFGKKKADVDA